MVDDLIHDHRSSLTDEERSRYDRQIILSGWGEEGQEKIKQASVFVAGAGGLGGPVATYLASAGVGCIRICDSGEVELSNLNRQILYNDDDIKKKKALSAKESIFRINPNVETVSLVEHITRENIPQLVSDARIIIDCLDNFQTRFIVNEYAVNAGIPFIHAGVYGMSGQITFIHSPETPCLRCIFTSAPPPETFPIVGATAGVVGCLEALEALKFLTGRKTLLKNRLLIWDGDLGDFEEIPVKKNPACPVCGSKGDI